MTDPLGNITTTLHDNMNRLTVQIDPVGNRTSYTYDANGRRTRVTAPLGRITTWLYDSNSRVVATIDPLALRTSYAYDAASNLIRTTNPLGQISTSVFRSGNRLIAQIDPLGNRTSYSYDASWNLIRVTNPLGQIYDQRVRHDQPFVGTHRRPGQPHEHDLRLRRRPDPDDKSARLHHDDRVRQTAAGPWPASIRCSIGPRQRSTSTGRQIRTTNPLGFSTTTVYDAASRTVANVDPLLNRTSYAYDAASRPIRNDESAGISSTRASTIAASRLIASVDRPPEPNQLRLRRGQPTNSHHEPARVSSPQASTMQMTV